jgi:poly(A) polymerase
LVAKVVKSLLQSASPLSEVSGALLFMKALSSANEAYLVGGGVRDLILNRRAYDLDIIVPGAREIAQNLSEQLEVRLVTIGEESIQPVYRFVFPLEISRFDRSELTTIDNSGKFWVDLVELHPKNICKDLAERDFTINAMALPLDTFLDLNEGRISKDELKSKVVDPFNGIGDLQTRKLKEVSPAIFKQDPVRLWRMWRLAAELDFEPGENLLKLAFRDKNLCRNAAGERVSDELFKLLRQPKAAKFLIKAGKSGLVESQFPAMKELKGCEQGSYHHQDAWEHSFQVVVELENLINRIGQLFPEEAVFLNEWLFSNNDLPVLKLSALLHDIGKPLAKQETPNMDVHFFGHEEAGLAAISDISQNLRLSRRDENLLLFLVNKHLHIQDIIARAKRSTQAKFWYRFGEDTLGLVLLGCADLLSKSGPAVDKSHVGSFIGDYVPLFLGVWRDDVIPSLKVEPLIDGKDIMELFSLPPGKKIGVLKEVVRNAQVEGKVTTREEAISMVSSTIINKGIN